MNATRPLRTLTLECAQHIVNAALRHGRSANMQPLVVAVLDVRGTLVAYAAEDGSSLYRFDIARGKAMGALGLGFGGQELERRAGAMPMFINAVQALSDGNMVPVRGGVLVRDAEGALLGAVGISGDVSANDELAAVAGVQSAGLEADTGAPKA